MAAANAVKTARVGARRLAAGLGSTPGRFRAHPQLLAVLALGLVLRLLYSVWFWPVNGGYYDSSVLLDESRLGVFRDPLRLPGYPFMLRVVEHVWSHAFAIVLLQYAMGFVTAILLYRLVWSATGVRWAAALPAIYVMASGDQLVSEHSILSETTMVFATTLAVALWTVAVRRDRVWLWALTGACLTCAGSVRFGPVVVAAGVAATAVLVPGAWRSRARRAGWVVAGALPVLVVWGVAQHSANGKWIPGYQATGWSLYARVAPFADCRRTPVAADLRFLCDDPAPIRDPDIERRRGGPGYYLYEGGPAVRRFGPPTPTGAAGSATLQRFALTVILHQPLDYLRAVSSDTLRYFDRGIGYQRRLSGSDSNEQDIPRRAPLAEVALEQSASRNHLHLPAFSVDDEIGMLGDWQRVWRLGGLGLLVVLLLALAAALRPGAGRREAQLCVGLALLFAVLPAATQVVSFRHGIPVIYLLVTAAALFLGREVAVRRT